MLLGDKAPLAWKTWLFIWGIALSAWEALSLAEHLTAWEEAKLLPELLLLLTAWEEAKLLPELVLPELEEGELLPSWEIALLALPSLEGMLLGWTALASWEAVLSCGRGEPAYLWGTSY